MAKILNHPILPFCECLLNNEDIFSQSIISLIQKSGHLIYTRPPKYRFQVSNLVKEFTVLSGDFQLDIPEKLFKKFVYQGPNPEVLAHKFYGGPWIQNF